MFVSLMTGRANNTFLSYVVLQDGRLGMITREDECLATAIVKPITNLAKVDKGWVLDPNPE